MIISIKDNEEKIIAYIEFWQVAESGFPKAHGEYMWVQEMWIHNDYRGKGLLKKLATKALSQHPDIKYGYWYHEKYNNRLSKLMSRERFMKSINNMEFKENG